MTRRDAEASPGARLPWTRKLGYGSAELGLVSVEVLIELYLLKYYHVVVGLSPALTGLAIAIALIWDAVSDPIMGGISDRTRHPSGRRRPYIIPGAIALALTFIAIFNPPEMTSETAKFLYLLVAYLGVTTAMTVVGVPHLALGGELSFDRNERTEVFGYRRLFTTLGLLLGTMLPALILRAIGGEEDADDVAHSRALTSVVLAAPLVITAWITVWSTRGLDRPSTGARVREGLTSLLTAQLGAMRHPVFFPVLLAFIISGVGRALNASTALYYYEHKIGLPESDTVLYVLLPFFFSILASVPGWTLLSRRAGKKWPAFWGVLGLGLLVTIGYPLLPPDQLLWPILVAIVGGIMAGSVILYESIVADIVDFDMLETGRNREGLYFGVWRMGTKLSRAIGIALAGILLGWTGFVDGAAEQSREVAANLGLLFGPGVGAFLIVAALVFTRTPFSDAAHRRVQAQLRDRSGPAGDPPPSRWPL